MAPDHRAQPPSHQGHCGGGPTPSPTPGAEIHGERCQPGPLSPGSACLHAVGDTIADNISVSVEGQSQLLSPHQRQARPAVCSLAGFNYCMSCCVPKLCANLRTYIYNHVTILNSKGSRSRASTNRGIVVYAEMYKRNTKLRENFYRKDAPTNKRSGECQK